MRLQAIRAVRTVGAASPAIRGRSSAVLVLASIALVPISACASGVQGTSRPPSAGWVLARRGTAGRGRRCRGRHPADRAVRQRHGDRGIRPDRRPRLAGRVSLRRSRRTRHRPSRQLRRFTRGLPFSPQRRRRHQLRACRAGGACWRAALLPKLCRIRRGLLRVRGGSGDLAAQSVRAADATAARLRLPRRRADARRAGRGALPPGHRAVAAGFARPSGGAAAGGGRCGLRFGPGRLPPAVSWPSRLLWRRATPAPTPNSTERACLGGTGNNSAVPQVGYAVTISPRSVS